MKRAKFFSSWSGGKDSSLALYKEIEKGEAPALLLSIFREDGYSSRAHGLRREIIEAQGESLDIPVRIVEAEWGNYRDVFREFLIEAKSKGIEYGVFGDIDLTEHRDWIEQMTSETEVVPCFPLWGTSREEVVKEFIEKGFYAVIVSCRKDILDKSFLGRKIDHDLLDEFRVKGVDVSGENGEYHTLVLDGPIFNKKLDIELGDITEDDRHYYIEVSI